MDSNSMNPNWAPPPPKPGMSGAAKVLIGLGIGCGLMLLLCCGGFFGFGLYMQRWLTKSVISDPAAVDSIAASMAKIEVPAGLKPTVGFRMQEIFGQQVEGAFPTFALYADQETESQLLLESLPVGPAVRNRQGQDPAEGLLLQKNISLNKDLKVEKKEVKEVEIGGEKTSFTISKGKSSSGKNRIQVTGSFEGNDGPVNLWLSVDADKYNEETVTKMLESIRVDSGEAKPDKDAPEENPAPKKPEKAKPVKLSPAKPKGEKAEPSP